MPIEELLALYNCVTPPVHSLSSSSGSGASRRRSKSARNVGSEKYLMPPPEPPKCKTPGKELGEKLAVENPEDKAETVVVKDEAKSPETANNNQSIDDSENESKPLDESVVDKKPIIERKNDANNENGAIKEVKEEQIDQNEISKVGSSASNVDQNSKPAESNAKTDDDSPGKSNAHDEMEIDEGTYLQSH